LVRVPGRHGCRRRRAALGPLILAAQAAGKLDADIDLVVSLDEIRDAHRRIDAGHNLGKIVVAL